MDNPTPPVQPVIPPPVLPTKPKSSGTTFLIILLFVIATLGTGLAYLFLSHNTSKNVTSLTPTPTPRENAKWQTYTNTKYHYSFAYPVTWQMTSTAPYQKEFELRYIGGPDLGIIKGTYLTPDERGKLPPIYCLITLDHGRCHIYRLAKDSTAILDRLVSGKAATTMANAIVALPSHDSLLLQITHGNNDSYGTLTILLDTLIFPGDKKLYGFQICPDSWPVNGPAFDYNGVKFPTEDIDATWVKANCKYPTQ